MSMFFAPVVLTRDIAPTLRSFDRRFERFINDHFFAAPAQAGPIGADRVGSMR